MFSAPFVRTPATFRKAHMKTLYFIGGPMGVGKTAACRALNEAFAGRGGGKAGFCQGSLADADAARVRAFLRQL